MANAVVWYTILCVALNQVATGGGSNLMNPEDEVALHGPHGAQIHSEREKGSKWVFVSEHAFILCVWSLKACMLVIYSRITYVLQEALSLWKAFANFFTERDSVNKDGSRSSPYTSPLDLSLPSFPCS